MDCVVDAEVDPEAEGPDDMLPGADALLEGAVDTDADSREDAVPEAAVDTDADSREDAVPEAAVDTDADSREDAVVEGALDADVELEIDDRPDTLLSEL